MSGKEAWTSRNGRDLSSRKNPETGNTAKLESSLYVEELLDRWDVVMVSEFCFDLQQGDLPEPIPAGGGG